MITQRSQRQQSTPAASSLFHFHFHLRTRGTQGPQKTKNRKTIQPPFIPLSCCSPPPPPPCPPPQLLHCPEGWPLAGGQTLGDRGETTTLQARSAAAMQGFPGGFPDPQQLQATMLAIEQACSLIQVPFRSPLPR